MDPSDYTISSKFIPHERHWVSVVFKDGLALYSSSSPHLEQCWRDASVFIERHQNGVSLMDHVATASIDKNLTERNWSVLGRNLVVAGILHQADCYANGRVHESAQRARAWAAKVATSDVAYELHLQALKNLWFIR